MITATILGCGASSGTPVIGCGCDACRSPDPRNTRLRSSLLLRSQTTTILVDTSPDLRAQAFLYDIPKLSAIFYTHAHADHVHGIDDVRAFNQWAQDVIPVYGDAATLTSLQSRFAYAFMPPHPINGQWFRPTLEAREVTPYLAVTIGDITLIPFTQRHGKIASLGLRVGDFAYSTDVDGLSEASFTVLRGVQQWVVDCLRYEHSPTHATLPVTLPWIERVQPRCAILTHMSHELEYHSLARRLPDGVEPGYDGMKIVI